LNKRALIEKAIKGEEVDKIPWTIYRSLLPWGEKEFEFRTDGLGLIYEGFPVSNSQLPDIEIIDKTEYFFGNSQKRNVINRQFNTPLGKVDIIYEHLIDSSPQLSDIPSRFGTSDVMQRELSWITKFPFENETDYERLEFIYDNIRHVPIDEEYIMTDRIVGDEGLVMLNGGRSPFSLILFSLMGYEKCYIEYHDNRKRFLKFFEFLYQKSRQQYILASKSSAFVVWCPDNITSGLIPPYIFKEFFIPFYNDVAEILHKSGKVLAVHMDGTLKALVDLIKETKIDIIEAFTPPPMGDLQVGEAREKWQDKVLWINFPGTLIASGDFKNIKDYTERLVRDIYPAEKFLVGFIRKIFHWTNGARPLRQFLKLWADLTILTLRNNSHSLSVERACYLY